MARDPLTLICGYSSGLIFPVPLFLQEALSTLLCCQHLPPPFLPHCCSSISVENLPPLVLLGRRASSVPSSSVLSSHSPLGNLTRACDFNCPFLATNSPMSLSTPDLRRYPPYTARHQPVCLTGSGQQEADPSHIRFLGGSLGGQFSQDPHLRLLERTFVFDQPSSLSLFPQTLCLACEA